MARTYIAFGTALCLFFGYATWSGWSVWDTATSGNWSPQGQRDVNHK